MNSEEPLGFLSLEDAPRGGDPVVLAYRPGVVDYLRAVDFEVVLVRFCSGSSTEGWGPLSLNPDDPVACRLGVIERPLGWLPLSVFGARAVKHVRHSLPRRLTKCS